MMNALVIVPTYNERENLPRLAPAILGQSDAFHLLIVDDNSPDGTGRIADDLAAADPRVHVLHRDGKRGLGTAYVAGFKWALEHGFEYVFEMDADFSHDPADLPRLLDGAKRSGVAVGSRWVAGGGTENWSLLRTLISRGGSMYAKLILGVPVNDLTSGFKCFSSSVLRKLDLDSLGSNGYAFQVEVNFRCHRLGYRIVEVPIRFVDRRVGKSKMSSGIVIEAMGVVWKLRLWGTAAAAAPRPKYSKLPPS
jgi:dolichol-phosphate mannosyltransferase